MWSRIGVVTTNGSQYPFLRFATFALLYALVAIEFINGPFVVVFTWVVIIGLVNTIRGVWTTLVVVVGSAELQFKFLTTETPFDSLPNFITDPINTPLLTTFMFDTIIVSNPMVGIPS